MSFESIHQVNASVTDCDMPFNYADRSPLFGKNYYRLQMHDEDGLKKYSQVICLDRSAGADFQLDIAPNPVSGSVMRVQLWSAQTSNVTFKIVDMTGKNVWQQHSNIEKGALQFSFDIISLSNGIYILVYQEGVQNKNMSFRVE